jgi:amino acid adenylation domain-containing protein
MSLDEWGWLSPGERALWSLQRLTPATGAYNLAGAVRIADLDRTALRRALLRLVERHPALRTTYPAADDGEPFRCVHETLEPEVAEEDLEPDGGPAALQRRLEAEAVRPFDPTAGPLLRVRIFAAPGGGCAILFVLHHLIADFGSLALALRELGIFYGKEMGNRTGDDAGGPPATYAAWVAALERGLASPRAERLRAFWRERLAGPPPALELPADRRRLPGLPSGAGDARSVRFGAVETARLLALGRSRGATLFAVLLAGFQLLLHRLAGQVPDEVWIGVPTAGRGAARWAGTVGYFVNPVVMRGRPGAARSMGALVAAARDEARGALAHRDWPFPLLAADLQPVREAGLPPLFQAMLTVHRTRHAEEEAMALLALGEGGGRACLGGLSFATLPLRFRAAQLDLALAAAVVGGELLLRLEVDADRFDGSTAARLLSHLTCLLEAAGEEPEAAPDALPLLTAAERQQVLVEWSEGLPAPAAAATVLSLFAARAAAAPGKPAVLFAGRVVRTRGALVRRAARLAAVLADLGAGPGMVVGVCLGHSSDLVEAVLGVLATGAAYLPLDPTYPRAYLAHVLEDSGAPLVLTRDNLRALLPETRGRVIVLPESPDDAAQGEPSLRELPPGDPGAPAYLLYTSGSTGRPKGIPILHRSLAAYLAWVLEAPLAGIDGLPFVTSLSFDASLKQLFGPLVGGFPVRLVDEETARRPERLLAHLGGPGRLALNCVPSLWREILDAIEAAGGGGPPGLVRVLLGGEGFDRGLLERTARVVPGIEVWNLYGPTEATANAAAARLEPGTSLDTGISIGHPIRGARLHIVDPCLRPLPPGIAGELVLGGAGVAPGYWQRPELTAERFVPDPFSREPGGRLHRTGDRARFRAGGTVELLGRIDLQLKVRGLRIEPGEIEAVLLAHPAVAECAVGADPGRDHLIAWVVFHASTDPPEPAALRRHLAARLPAAMVPAVLVAVDGLPRTPAGKVDRGALAVVAAPAASAASVASPGRGQAPRAPTEEILAGIWAEVLGIEEVGVHDDFFAHGGHSLLAARLLSRVRNAFGVDLPLRALFAAPTVARLAAAVRRGEAAAEPVPPPVTRVPEDARMFLSFAQERLWFLGQWMPDSPAYNNPAAVRLAGPLDVRALAAGLGEIVRRHEVLRTTFSAIAGLPVQILRPWAGLPLRVVDLTALGAAAQEAAGAALADDEARRPFDLRRGPLLRACLLRRAADEHVLLVSLHHIVADGWSMGVLIGELGALYGSVLAGRPSSLPPLPVQYADFAAWQRRRAEDEPFARDLAWWRAFLGGAPAGIDLPTDRPRPAWSIHRGALAPFRLGPAFTGRLRALARRSGATLFMTLLAAFQALLARLSGAADLVVGTAVDQRTPEVEGLIGLFVNLLALRGDLSGDPPFSDLLARTRRTTLDAHDHRDLPFERLVAEIEPVRHPGRNPLFQVAFSLQSAPLPEPALAGLELAVRELDTRTARFDLTLLLREAGGGVAGSLEHSSDLFDAATVDRLLAGLATLLDGVATDGSLPLSRLPLLTLAERRQILEDWGRSEDLKDLRDGARRDACLHQLFACQAARTPAAVAMVAGEMEITYRELARRGGVLARRLRGFGVGPDVPVALCLERSPEMVAGMLGILGAGGAYVPLDLGYPRERLAWMLADSGARIAVARGAGIFSLEAALGANPGTGDVRVVDLESLEEGLAEGEDEDGGVHPDNLASIVYTSGSTGRPKGVAATHRGAIRLVVDPGYADLGPEETILQLAPVSFDASTFEIWGALLNGGRLVLPPPGPVALRELGEALRRHRVTTLFLTTGLFHQMIDEEAARLAGLRQLLFGGDVASVAHIHRALELLPGVRLIHAYGPTEATTFATCGTVTAANAARAALSLGRPVPRTSVHILDAGLEPVPPGVPGELYLGGDGLARGYWRRPDLTAARFVPSPFPLSAVGGERLFRTGDLARWLSDGTVDFLGRIDRQVKIRGFRVEPEEVEATLDAHPGVAACVVLPRGEAEDKRLVAWVVADGDPAPGDGDLLAWCRERLPSFLVPAAFVRIEALPLGSNGKVDRRALPEPDRSRPAAAYVAPRTPVEEKVAAVWAEVLGVDQVGAEDDFFVLGGHSLLATQIVSRLSRDFGLELGLRAFFEEPTVTGVAMAITREQIRQGDPEQVVRLVNRVQSLSPEDLAALLREERE